MTIRIKVVIGMGILVLALTLCPGSALAKMIRGEVVAIKDDGSSFTFKHPNPSKPSVAEQFEIVMRSNTKFEKISSLKELAAGDDVVVDVIQKRGSKIWEARSVRIFKMRLYQTDVAQKARPD